MTFRAALIAGFLAGLPAPSAGVPPSAEDMAYEARVRASQASAQGHMGPLDGSWILVVDGTELVTFQLADQGNGVVEGAWRDISRPGARDASGFIDRIEVTGSRIVLRFDDGRQVVRLDREGDHWTGELEQAGQTRPVSLRKNAP